MPLTNALARFDNLVAELRSYVYPAEVAQLMQTAESVYLLAPTSYLGQAYGSMIARHFLAKSRRVILVDDTLSAVPQNFDGCRLIKTGAFRDERPSAGLGINLANTIFVHRLFAGAAASAGVPTLDMVPVLGELGLGVVYQGAHTMREATLARLTDYQVLARELSDALSIETLSAFLRLRVKLDRNAMLPVLCSVEDEYFSLFPAGRDLTFQLEPNEIICDVGAHVGTTVRKFLSATQWRYRGIHAFEPDKGSFAALTQGTFAGLANFHPRNLAVSDKKEVLRFNETGTMGSRLDNKGNVEVQTSTLDEEVPEATFIKMDVEGHETKVLHGARRLIRQFAPRLAVTAYHYADDLLNIVTLLREIEPRYRLRLRHHSFYYYDTIVYADLRP